MQEIYLENNQIITPPDLTGFTELTRLWFAENQLSDVDSLLVVLAAESIAGGRIHIDGGTNARPTQKGMDAIALLTARWWDISTN